MDRTNAPGHVNHLFVAEDPATNRPPTEITAQDLNAHQEELINIILAAQLAPAAGNNAQVLEALNAMFAKINGATGLIRTLTPAGGARIRELGDIANAATVGGIEFGVSYNCNIDPATGVWAGRDVADICWLEKWTDAGGIKEFWYAPTGAAGAAPAWALAGKIDLVNGTPQFDSSKSLATTEFAQSIGLRSNAVSVLYATAVLTAAQTAGKTIVCGAAAPITLTLPLVSSVRDGTQVQFANAAAVAGATATLALSGTNKIVGLDGADATSYVLNPYMDEVTLVASSALDKWVIVTNSSIGVAQKWLDVTASRVKGTTYTNTSGRPIMVRYNFTGGGQGASMLFNCNGIQFSSGQSYAASALTPGGSYIVPPGATYSVSDNTLTNVIARWDELR